MALNRLAQIMTMAVIATVGSMPLRAQAPCATQERRALVLSGGGLKGAFEAGAVYHLVIHRGCDFHDFAGVSVGALNGAILAQASPSDDASESRRNLALHAEQMVSVWENLKGSRDIVHSRMFGGVRFAALGAENINDFSPLRHLLESAVSLELLSQGRPLRVGVTSFADGTYREVWMDQSEMSVPRSDFMEYLFASSMLPVIGRMPRIADAKAGDGRLRQFADGGMRHVTPVASYFRAGNSSNTGDSAAHAEHQSLQQLFVIGTSPYERGSEVFPAADAHCCKPGTQIFDKGSRVIRRAIALMADTPYRADLEAMWMANDMLAWRAAALESLRSPAQSTHPATSFPFESYNRDPLNSEAASRPYRIGFVVPLTENVDISDLLALTPEMVREQLLAGCLAADRMMTTDFALPQMSDTCESRFGTRRKASGVQIAER